MKHYVTIYIQAMDWNIPHAFLGLTKGKNPDELDKIEKTIKILNKSSYNTTNYLY